MRIAVAIKRVPAPEQRIRARAGSIDDSGLSYTINPFDAIALEEALRIRERHAEISEILAVSIGGVECEDQLRTVLAMGADRALRVTAANRVDPWNIANVLAAVVRREEARLVLMGKQAIDDDSNQAGQFLAALLEWPQAMFASKIELCDGESLSIVRVTRETDAGIERLLLKLPAVISTDLRLNEPRYASLPSIMRARKKTIEQATPAELGVVLEPRIEILALESATSMRTCQRVKGVGDLVHLLRTEAKVI